MMNTEMIDKSAGEIQDGWCEGAIPPAPFQRKGENEGALLWIFCSKCIRKKSTCGANPRWEDSFLDRELDGHSYLFSGCAQTNTCGADQGWVCQNEDFFAVNRSFVMNTKLINRSSDEIKDGWCEGAIPPAPFQRKGEKDGVLLWIFCSKCIRKKSTCGAEQRSGCLFLDEKLENEKIMCRWNTETNTCGANPRWEGSFLDCELDGYRNTFRGPVQTKTSGADQGWEDSFLDRELDGHRNTFRGLAQINICGADLEQIVKMRSLYEERN